jgi:hypothetical protein
MNVCISPENFPLPLFTTLPKEKHIEFQLDSAYQLIFYKNLPIITNYI